MISYGMIGWEITTDQGMLSYGIIGWEINTISIYRNRFSCSAIR